MVTQVSLISLLKKKKAIKGGMGKKESCCLIETVSDLQGEEFWRSVSQQCEYTQHY